MNEPMNYDKRLERLEQDMQPDTDANMIVGYLEPGQDKATKVAELMRDHNLSDSSKIIVVEFVAPGTVGPATIRKTPARHKT